MRLLQLTWLLPIVLAYAGYVSAEMKVEYAWTYIDFVWESDDQKQEAIDSGKYDYTKLLPEDFLPLNDGRVLVACPKYSDNAATLATISDQTGDGGPLLAPYPDWSWNTAEDCSGITSVSRVILDCSGYLWFVDAGKVGSEQKCPVVIYKFDTETDEVLLRVEIPVELYSNPNKIVGRIEIQQVQETDDGFLVWIVDDSLSGLIFYDGEKMWRRNDTVFESTAPDFSIDGSNFTMGRGLHNVITLPGEFFEESWVIFKPLSGRHTFIGNIAEMMLESGSEPEYYVADWTLPSQETTKAIAKNSNTLFGYFPTEMQLGCWNTGKPLTEDNVGIVDVACGDLGYVSNMKFTEDEEGNEDLWVMSTAFHKYRAGTIDFTENICEILIGSVQSLIADTVCEKTCDDTPTTLEDMNFVKVDECS